jgi:DNA-binding SARP family transcriptional activator
LLTEAKVKHSGERPVTRLRGPDVTKDSDDGYPAAGHKPPRLEQTPPLRVQMFGPLAIRSTSWESQVILGPRDLGGVKPKRLFELLLLARGHAVSKSVLAEQLWPDAKLPKNVAATLENYISILRRCLHEAFGTSKDVIVTEFEAYRINLDFITCDLFMFESGLAVAHSQESDARVTEEDVLDCYEHALAIPSGVLLEDEPYLEWIVGERTKLQTEIVDASIESSKLALLSHDAISARRHASVALSQDPVNERAMRCLMRALTALGSRIEAIRVFEDTRARIKDELGVDLDRESLRLANALLSNHPSHGLASVTSTLAEHGLSESMIRTLIDACRLAHRSAGRPGLVAMLEGASTLYAAILTNEQAAEVFAA